MINEKYHAPDGRGLKLKLPVPVGTRAGVPVHVGDLLVIPTTPRATAELRGTSGVPQGLRDGEASCFIPGLGSVLGTGAGTPLGAMPAGAAAGKKIYDADGTLSLTGTEAQHIGYAIPLPEPERGWGVGIRGN